MPLIKGGTGKELRKDITKPSLDFLAVLHVKKVRTGLPECTLKRSPFQRRSCLFGQAVKCSRCCRHCTSFQLRITLSLFSAYSSFFYFRRASRQKRQKCFLPGSALERAPFQRRSDLFAQAKVKSQSSIMLASLSSSHFIPAAHHVSSF